MLYLSVTLRGAMLTLVSAGTAWVTELPSFHCTGTRIVFVEAALNDMP